MSRSWKFVPPLAVAFALFAALGLTLASSNAAQLGVQAVGVQPVGVRPAFDQKVFRSPNLGTQRTVGIANSINKNRNIAKGVSPDG
jgi:hypothetical protein